ncbi:MULTISPECIES: M20/M25/M40 family metallo-hydrolase [unclassified Enterococcus]|uniref:M20/M25/M40 family metallo-hydrolase n=1 Tax=unclassified Enterococcus TaxID=2608891 RepID=UPI001551CDFD|nr:MULTISPECIES: M20/M25/M40 family metallo-hydrolase [unclassified Enterococcus]MBS7575926.1 M20/M25/M40 family metallo-hydrolase [Enterococcus sp. MMGLQ5-2]MBS7583159.1 M20/M25/M40 family metallo-hydrolase [Enterococcus sp. MMGLQ5-1]NPD11019.1 M20/M25/M40 family metallo-hydrolase [Enterococcus sp. MMGLQ5-1]NPD35762.1 M20/M25/M40 family metallo-hydrolase [Enterococcus sp. MMGLQ5-2]
MTKNKLVEVFKTLVAIDSVSGNEKEIHDYLKKIFSSYDLKITEDDSMQKTGLGANNLIATLHGNPDKEPLLFSSHTDTVVPGTGVRAVEKNGILYSEGDTILGADDKAGIAIMIEAIRRIRALKLDTGDLEFILSPGEEIGLIGSSALDIQLVKSKMGYVLDSAGTVGKVTIASPTLFMYEVKITGHSAHAGLEPEKGVSAVDILTSALTKIKTGRIDEQTTANIGVIQGGEATNIVMDQLIVKGEVRAINPTIAETLISEMKSAFETAATTFGGKVSIDLKKMATGFNISDDEVIMRLLEAAANNLNYTVIKEISGGGSDANIFNEKGKKVVNLSIGYEKIHTTDEYIPIEEMERAVNLVLELAKNSPPKER